ncbi:MAG: hypothetical protein NZ959_09145 [Armatimonadetes bacterium]|nr:hypothetical protein [Armatimonadota bacterium]MDW8122784.1 hypothetical protein [Armatimonadota bacterium]
MTRPVPLWLGVVVIALVILVVGFFVWRSNRPPAMMTEEQLRNPPNPAVTARPHLTPTAPTGQGPR